MHKVELPSVPTSGLTSIYANCWPCSYRSQYTLLYLLLLNGKSRPASIPTPTRNKCIGALTGNWPDENSVQWPMIGSHWKYNGCKNKRCNGWSWVVPSVEQPPSAKVGQKVLPLSYQVGRNSMNFGYPPYPSHPGCSINYRVSDTVIVTFPRNVFPLESQVRAAPTFSGQTTCK